MYCHAPHHNLSVNNGPHIYMALNRYNWTEKFLSPTDVTTQGKGLLPYLRWCGVNKPMALAVIWKYCTCHYGQYILIDSDNNNKWLSYWFLYAQYYTCIVILECTLSTYKKVCCRTVCSVVKAAAFISCFYYVSWSHHFSWLIWSCVVFHNYTLYKLVA